MDIRPFGVATTRGGVLEVVVVFVEVVLVEEVVVFEVVFEVVVPTHCNKDNNEVGTDE